MITKLQQEQLSAVTSGARPLGAEHTFTRDLPNPLTRLQLEQPVESRPRPSLGSWWMSKNLTRWLAFAVTSTPLLDRIPMTWNLMTFPHSADMAGGGLLVPGSRHFAFAARVSELTGATVRPASRTATIAPSAR